MRWVTKVQTEYLVIVKPCWKYSVVLTHCSTGQTLRAHSTQCAVARPECTFPGLNAARTKKGRCARTIRGKCPSLDTLHFGRTTCFIFSVSLQHIPRSLSPRSLSTLSDESSRHISSLHPSRVGDVLARCQPLAWAMVDVSKSDTKPESRSEDAFPSQNSTLQWGASYSRHVSLT